MSFQSAKHANGSSNREAKGFLLLLIFLSIPFLLQYSYDYFFYKPQQSTILAITYLNDTCQSYYSTNTHSVRWSTFTIATMWSLFHIPCFENCLLITSLLIYEISMEISKIRLHDINSLRLKFPSEGHANQVCVSSSTC